MSRSLADRRVEVRYRCRAREARIDDDQLGAAVGLGLRDPFEAARMRLGGIAAHDDDEIGVLDVGPGIRHCATAECWGETGHRRAVSDTRLVVEHQHSGAADHLVGHERGFIGRRRGGEEAGRDPAVDGHAVIVGRDEVLVAIVLHQRGRSGRARRPS